MKRLLVTGASGFVGRHVEEACQRGGVFEGWNFIPLSRDVDITDHNSLFAAIARIKPDAVIHLAAQSFVPRSFENPHETFETNLVGTLNLVKSLEGNEFRGRLLYVSSGDVYGMVPEENLPVSESRIPEPRSPYAVSKIAAEQLCLQWHRSEGLDVVIARPFNHFGPGQNERFAVPAFATQIVAISDQRSNPEIRVGDVDTTRDFTDVRDIVAAYAALLSRGVAGETYNIGSGEETRVRDLLETMCEIERVEPEIVTDPSLYRKAEQRRMAADATKIKHDTGWSPRYSIRETLTDILENLRKNENG